MISLEDHQFECAVGHGFAELGGISTTFESGLGLIVPSPSAGSLYQKDHNGFGIERTG